MGARSSHADASKEEKSLKSKGQKIGQMKVGDVKDQKVESGLKKWFKK